MKLLLDTNALLWWLADSERLGPAARRSIADPTNAIYVSAASAWEIAIKIGLGKLNVPANATTWLPAALAANRFTSLPIEVEHALAVEQLPPHHKDPFDRLLIAQARIEGLTILTGDHNLEQYEVPIIRC
ncbi:MAG TPA: type II toxin-antitoxin system VapC family toxin [Chloroflexota bacterium]